MHLYLVTNPYTQQDGVIKVGYMSARRPDRIVSRYKTYYGSNTTVMCWKCTNAAQLEKQFKARFFAERLELELYDARFVVRYIHWITITTRSAPFVCTGTFMPSIRCVRAPPQSSHHHPNATVVLEPVGWRTRSRRLREAPDRLNTRS
jgi:hypothetical protein